MRLTFVNQEGDAYFIEIDPSIQLHDVMVLLEAESGIPVSDQTIYFEGTLLSNPHATMSQLGLVEDSMLYIRRPSNVSVGRQTGVQDAETARLQLLGNPELMARLQTTQPELSEAAKNDPARFAQLYHQLSERLAAVEVDRQRAMEVLDSDPFNVEAQRRIEEAIRQQAIMENMEHALEYSPESFGRVTMLYVPVEVNGRPVKAFVDSGAQQTIMSPECAEACNVTRLIDRRFAGIARGVGTAKILGRVHSAQLKVGDVFLHCSFTIIEGREVDLLLGLDMLKAHQACIDLEKNVLRIQGCEVAFLSEHELPEKARALEMVNEIPPSSGANTSTTGVGMSGAGPGGPSVPSHMRKPSGSRSFPGGGQRLGSMPAAANSQGSRPRASQSATSRHPENSIQILMDLGVAREEAIRLLDAAGGNVDVAASMLFL